MNRLEIRLMNLMIRRYTCLKVHFIHSFMNKVALLNILNMGFTSIYQLGQAERGNGDGGKPITQTLIRLVLKKNGPCNVHFNVAPRQIRTRDPLIKSQNKVALPVITQPPVNKVPHKWIYQHC